MKNKSTIFLTGATGLIGSYFLKIFLQNGQKVYVLARSRGNKNAQERVINVLKFWNNKFSEKRINNVIVLEGDISRTNLGLDKKIRDILKNDIEEIFHCAAATNLNDNLEELRRVNVEGTRNLLKLAKEYKREGRLRKVNHISTAYVCGDYRGLFKENDLSLGQKFNTAYEQSKFETEKLVQENRKQGLWIDIFRPSLVLGESTTGKTSIFQSLFRAIHLLNLEIFEAFPGKGIPSNITNVDFLVKSIITLNSYSDLINENYHTFSPQLVYFEEIINIASEFLGFKKPKLIHYDKFDKNNITFTQKKLLDNTVFAFNPHVILDSNKTNKILRKYDFRFPEINKNMILKLLKYALKVKFIKYEKIFRKQTI